MSEKLELESLRRRLYQTEARLYRAERVMRIATEALKDYRGALAERLCDALGEYKAVLQTSAAAPTLVGRARRRRSP
jgi:hypothetical protein